MYDNQIKKIYELNNQLVSHAVKNGVEMLIVLLEVVKVFHNLR